MDQAEKNKMQVHYSCSPDEQCTAVFELIPSNARAYDVFVDVMPTAKVLTYTDPEKVRLRVRDVYPKIEAAKIPSAVKELYTGILDCYITIRQDAARVPQLKTRDYNKSDSTRWDDSLHVVEFAAKGRLVETPGVVDKILNFPVNKHVILMLRRLLWDLRATEPGPQPFSQTSQSRLLFRRLHAYVLASQRKYKEGVMKEMSGYVDALPDVNTMTVLL